MCLFFWLPVIPFVRSCVGYGRGGGTQMTSNNPSSGDLSDVDYMNAPDDFKSCFFGPDYFRGVQWGAGSTLAPVLLMARRSYRRARMAMPLSCIPAAGPFRVLRGMYRFDSWSVLLVTTCAIAATLKTGKFVLSRGRLREFELDEELSIMNATDEELEAMAALEVFRDAAIRGERLIDSDAAADDARRRRMGGRDIGTAANRRTQFPTFWDGFAVGVLGSLVDAHTPSKPPSAYLYLRAGRLGLA